MNKSEIAEKELEVAKWLQKQGYDRRVYKEVAPIIVEYLIEFKLLNILPDIDTSKYDKLPVYVNGKLMDRND